MNVTSIGWQTTLSDPIWYMSSFSNEAFCELLYPITVHLATNYKQTIILNCL